jgi:hypothetical protein
LELLAGICGNHRFLDFDEQGGIWVNCHLVKHSQHGKIEEIYIAADYSNKDGNPLYPLPQQQQVFVPT